MSSSGERIARIRAGACLAALLIAAQGVYGTPLQTAATIVFRGATVIDGTGRPPIASASVVVTGDRITAVEIRDAVGRLKTVHPDGSLVRTARALGVGECRLLVGHALPHAMLPVTTMIALSFGSLFSGALVVETTFAYLGVGKLIFDAILGSDFNLALLALMLATLVTILSNLAADLAYAWLDPRISYAERRH
jgi:peptide/nickel transport system permease protein